MVVAGIQDALQGWTGLELLPFGGRESEIDGA